MGDSVQSTDDTTEHHQAYHAPCPFVAAVATELVQSVDDQNVEDQRNHPRRHVEGHVFVLVRENGDQTKNGHNYNPDDVDDSSGTVASGHLYGEGVVVTVCKR